MNEQTKFTPGPWHFNPETGNVHGGKPSHGLCAVVALVGMGPEMDANARLIAAAPEMLAALKDIFGFLRSHGYNTDLVRAVIAKAEGKE